MAKHTPGPWKLDGRGYRPDTRNGGEFIPIISECGNWIADVRTPPANAHLITAAPDMLVALKALVDRYTALVNSGDCGFWDPETETEIITARAAIAKATEKDQP